MPRVQPVRAARGKVYNRRGTEDYYFGDDDSSESSSDGDQVMGDADPQAEEEPEIPEAGQPREPGPQQNVQDPPPLPPLNVPQEQQHSSFDENDHVNFKNNRLYGGNGRYSNKAGIVNLFARFSSNGKFPSDFKPESIKSLKQISNILRLGAKRFMLTRNTINNLCIQAGFKHGATPDVVTKILASMDRYAWEIYRLMQDYKRDHPEKDVFDDPDSIQTPSYEVDFAGDETSDEDAENLMDVAKRVQERNIDYSMDDDEGGKKSKARYLEMIQTDYPYLMKALFEKYKSVSLTMKNFAPYFRVSNSEVYSTAADLKKLIESNKFKYLGRWQNLLDKDIVKDHEETLEAVKDILYVLDHRSENFTWFHLREPYEFE